MKRERANWKILRAALWQRSGGRCEASGLALDPDTFDAHHRRPKGMGGTYRPDTDTLPNLIALDPQVHNGGPRSVHGRRSWSEERGYLIPKHEDDVTLWPIHLHGRTWVFLLPDGGYLRA